MNKSRKCKRGFVNGITSILIFLVNFNVNATIFNANVSVIVLQQTCDITSSINPNQPITIDFGDISVPKINGLEYQREIPFNLNCSDGANNPALKLRIVGSDGIYSTMLGTSRDNLSIIFRFGNNILNLNGWANFNYSLRPKLTAAPFTMSHSTLTGGTFTASATLVVEYQ
ncbi:fimbrial protein [Providencia rettgeri]|nr:fimbrial protein [Providencia rettgeri]